MLRKIRIGISALLFVLITFFFLDFAEILPNSFHRLAHLQFVPALLSLSVGILLFLIVLTLLFGRIYCSTICPMGILQDIIARLSKSTSKKKKRYSYSPAKNRLRWSVLGGTVISFLCGFTFIVGGGYFYFKYFISFHCSRHTYNDFYNGMEARTDLVQHDLSCRNNFRLIKPVLIIQSPH